MASGIHVYCGYQELENGEYRGGFRIVAPDYNIDIALACADETFANSLSATTYAEIQSDMYLGLLQIFGMIPPGHRTIIRQDINPN